MIKFIGKTNFDFIGKRYYFFAFSAFIMLAGIVSIYVKGINMGLDFAGGSMIQVKFERKIDISELRKALEADKIESVIQTYEDNSFGIKVKGKQENSNEIAEKINAALARNIKTGYLEERRDYVGPVVGKDLAKKAIFAITLSLFGIIVYIAFRFSNPIWGATGVIGLMHDVFVAIAFLSLTNREIDLVVVAALLTIAGYSINDTIVIFDRMRENMKKFPKTPLGQIINSSVNETLSRTFNTSLTVLTVLAILFFFGGSGIDGFAFCMLIGCISGVYSTVALCTPLAYEWEKHS
ncbi:MAG: protein translocase subunit SecF [Elusimicrobia bacterium CG08_land_8_20_14_0_20_51_18]|nr:MAG: protein translocase subunit SecF [Elusimicrobia bacterium CG08_land_8_20_14_0_20_51_18]